VKFYTQSHSYFCGIDLHARCLYVCILDASGEPCVHKKISASPDALLKLIAPYREDIIIGVECMFSCVQKSIAFDLVLIDFYDKQLSKIEWHIKQQAKAFNQHTLVLLRSVPGIGLILSLVILCEIHDIARFPRVQDFASYARLVKR